MADDLFRYTHRSQMPLTNDYVFRTVFGRDTDESKAALIEILNIILERKADPIRFIIIKNPIDTADKEGQKDTIMDIKAETDSGDQLDIEMQSGMLKVYPDRVLFYGGRLVNSSLQKSDDYGKMKKSIVVSIINGIMFSNLIPCHNVFDVRERETGLLLSDRMEFHFLELGKISGDKPVECLTETEKLAVYFKYANDEKKKDYVQEILTEEGIAMTENVYRKLTQDEIEYEKMEARLKYQLQYNTDISLARREGLEQGLERGRAEAIIDLARAMKSNGRPAEQISEDTGLSADEIEKL